MQLSSKFGIYINPKGKKVVRINSPYWIPEEPEWIFLTPEVNATLVRVREVAQQKQLVDDSSDLSWGSIPLTRLSP